MSAEGFAKVAAGSRNLAIAAALAAGVIFLVYTARKAKQGADYLFNQSNERSLGTDVFDWIHGDPDYREDPSHEQQELATCRAIFRDKGDVKSQRCQELIARYGP